MSLLIGDGTLSWSQEVLQPRAGLQAQDSIELHTQDPYPLLLSLHPPSTNIHPSRETHRPFWDTALFKSLLFKQGLQR